MFKWMKNKKNPKITFATGIMIGVFVAASGVYALTLIDSKNVTYDNTSTNAESSNVQDALDEVHNRINYLYAEEPRYDFGTPTLASQIDVQKAVLSIGTYVFVRKKGNQLSVCIYRNEQLLCLKAGEENWENNKSILNETVFSDATCDATSNNAYCQDNEFQCNAYSNGTVRCHNLNINARCKISGNNVVCEQ